MTGLDKIIDRILADAKEEARMILETAQKDCRAAAEEHAARAEAIRTQIIEKAEAECEAIVAGAKSAAATTSRNIMLAKRQELIDRAFEEAKKEMRSTDFGKYPELLTALLTSALIEEARTADTTAAYGDEATEFDSYEVIFNTADREAYGEAVVENARRAALRHIGAERAAKLMLSKETADIEGGLILRYGSIEANCSLAMLMAQMRRSLEKQVASTLFPDTASNV